MRMVLKWLIVIFLFMFSANILGAGISDVIRDRNSTGSFMVGLLTTLIMGIVIVKLMFGMDIGL